MDLNQTKAHINNSLPYIISGSILINLFLTLGNPEIFLGKKTFFTQSILPISSIIFMLATIFLITTHKLPKLEPQNLLQKAIPIFIITTILATIIRQPQNTIWIASSLFLLFTLYTVNSPQLTKALGLTLIPITIIALLQFILQSDLSLQFLNEPNIHHSIKGISKIWSPFHETPQIRSYGLFPHPNILGSFSTLIIILNHNNPISKIHFLNLFTSFSISNNISHLIYQISQKKKYIILTAIFITLFTVIYRFPFNNSTNIQERTQQHQEIIQTTSSQNKPWQIQPIHNTYLYSLQNLGLIHLLSFIILNIALFKKDKATALCLNILFLSDHYFLTNPNSFYLLIIFLHLVSERNTIQIKPHTQPKSP